MNIQDTVCVFLFYNSIGHYLLNYLLLSNISCMLLLLQNVLFPSRQLTDISGKYLLILHCGIKLLLPVKLQQLDNKLPSMHGDVISIAFPQNQRVHNDVYDRRAAWRMRNVRPRYRSDYRHRGERENSNRYQQQPRPSSRSGTSKESFQLSYAKQLSQLSSETFNTGMLYHDYIPSESL